MAKKKEEKEKEVKEEEGVAEGVLKSVGKMIPGLAGLFESVTKSKVIKERLKEVDKEVEARLKGQPLKKVKPVVEVGYRIGSIKEGTIRGKFKTPEKRSIKKIKPEEPKKEELVDIFEEKNKLVVITELPRVKEKEIKVSVKGKKLTIKAGKQKKEVKLPYTVKSKIKKSFKNNILEIKLEKGK
ncbi:MAG: Hsp20/alpha crystallin family protein [Nanoarchaeota archaeon]|nr:Hsp20/alpha crystallin family protein [Nanoarchaeota archaeon]